MANDRPVRTLIGAIWDTTWGKICVVCSAFYAISEVLYQWLPDSWSVQVPRAYTIAKWCIVNVPPWIWLLLAVICFAAGTFKVLANHLADSNRIQAAVEKKLGDVDTALQRLADFRTHVFTGIQFNELLCEYTFLSFAEARWSELMVQYERMWSEVVVWMSQGQGMFSAPRYHTAKGNFERVSRDLEKFAEEALGIKEILSEHPNFTKDPLRVVKGEEEIPEDRRTDFRRLTDVRNTAATRISHIERTLAMRMQPAKDRLKFLGRK